jgi:hypothetical protein
MEQWKSILYKMMDESDEPKQVDKIAQKIFQYLAKTRIKDPRKFAERAGPEYDRLMTHLDNSEIGQELLRDDKFFDLTIELVKPYSKTNRSKD